LSKINVLDHGYVELIKEGCWGSDEIIIESARMSTNKGFQGWGPFDCPKCVEREKTRFVDLTDIGCSQCGGASQVEGDEKLLRYLYEHKHFTPFEMGGLTIEVQAPIMVFREWHRHRTQSYNEMSGRYTQIPELFYIPSIERVLNGFQSKTNKQGSDKADCSLAKAQWIQSTIRGQCESAYRDYNTLLECNVAKELARLVLPVNTYSRMRASANLRNWLGFLTLRMDPAAQWEIRQYANIVAGLIEERFPRTYELFNEGR
jgi:thymidylate synthase (FAD)